MNFFKLVCLIVFIFVSHRGWAISTSICLELFRTTAPSFKISSLSTRPPASHSGETSGDPLMQLLAETSPQPVKISSGILSEYTRRILALDVRGNPELRPLRGAIVSIRESTYDDNLNLLRRQGYRLRKGKRPRSFLTKINGQTMYIEPIDEIGKDLISKSDVHGSPPSEVLIALLTGITRTPLKSQPLVTPGFEIKTEPALAHINQFKAEFVSIFHFSRAERSASLIFFRR